MAGDSASPFRLAAQILRLRPAGLRFARHFGARLFGTRLFGTRLRASLAAPKGVSKQMGFKTASSPRIF